MVERLERDAIVEALQAAGGRKIRAAERLGISRPTLDKKIDEYAIQLEKSRRR
jgi:DNA-binding NtrC family response regulator